MAVRDIIEGRPVLLVIDIQQSDFLDDRAGVADGIPVMDGYRDRVIRTRELIDVAHETGVPIVFFKEIHRPDHVDFGRELDGSEGVHCIETSPLTEVADEMDMRPTDYCIGKRRYSCFFGTDLEILLKGLRAETLVLRPSAGLLRAGRRGLRGRLQPAGPRGRPGGHGVPPDRRPALPCRDDRGLRALRNLRLCYAGLRLVPKF
jgi:hypothetical protein